MTTHERTKQAALAALLLASTAAMPAHAGEVAKGDTSDKTIAFSNSHAGNSFRQVMIKSFEETAAQAVKDKIIKGCTVVSANNSVTEQASQMQNLILQGYSAITVLAGSDTALNGVVKDACDAGIVVVAFASGVTEPCAYRSTMTSTATARRSSIIWQAASAPKTRPCSKSAARRATVSTSGSTKAS